MGGPRRGSGFRASGPLVTRHNRDKPHGDVWSRWQAAQRLGPDSSVLTGAVGESRREWWPHLSPSVPESPYDDHVWLVVLLGEPSITCSWWLALPLALCPAPPCPLRVGLCLYALPVLPQEVRAEAGPTLPSLPCEKQLSLESRWLFWGGVGA